MKKLTIFTPTYNRAYCLIQLYKSLCIQKSTNFRWLIIDDGSTDNTKELVDSWISENFVEIEYCYKTNGGMHTGHNLAISLIETELNMCIDSDDYIPDDAVKNIITHWENFGSKNYAGILGLDMYKNGQIVSSKKFPENVISGKYSKLKSQYGIVGDVKFVYRTDVIKTYPNYPVFDKEKFTPLGYKYRIIDQDYDMIFLNKVLCVVEYMEDGSTKNIVKQYFKNPNGFRHSRLFTMKYSHTFKDKLIQGSHFIAESIMCKNFKIFENNKEKLITFLAIPLGIFLFFYLKTKINYNE